MTDLGLQQLNLFAGPAPSHLQQSIDDRIQIDLALVSHVVPPLARDGEERKGWRKRRFREAFGCVALLTNDNEIQMPKTEKRGPSISTKYSIPSCSFSTAWMLFFFFFSKLCLGVGVGTERDERRVP
jgi:hypothetical protein